jgi:predicted nucleotidyltransferase component of viral defense system
MEYITLSHNEILFSELLENCRIHLNSEGWNIRKSAIEKDFHVCEILKHVSLSKYNDDVVFKGGTSLSKAWKIVDRFSEDVDFCVLPKDGKKTSVMKTLKDKVSKFIEQAYPKIDRHPEERKEGGRRKTIHPYKKVVGNGKSDPALKEHIIVEITTESPTAMIPSEKKIVTSYLYDFLLKANQTELINKYGLTPIEVLVALPEKTLADKISRLAKISDKEDFDRRIGAVIRDLYDIHFLLSDKRVHEFFVTKEFAEMYDEVKKEEFISRKRVVPPLSVSPLFTTPKAVISRQEPSYQNLLESMVFTSAPKLSEIMDTFEKNVENFKKLDL